MRRRSTAELTQLNKKKDAMSVSLRRWSECVLRRVVRRSEIQRLRDQVVREQTLLKQDIQQARNALSVLCEQQSGARAELTEVLEKLNKEEEVTEAAWQHVIRVVESVVEEVKRTIEAEKQGVSEMEAAKEGVLDRKHRLEVQSEMTKQNALGEVRRCEGRIKEVETVLQVRTRGGVKGRGTSCSRRRSCRWVWRRREGECSSERRRRSDGRNRWRRRRRR